MIVALLLLFVTAFPILAPEKTPIVRAPIGPASDGASPAVASDGTNFLVASGAYAMLVDRDGKPMLPESVVVPASRPVMPGSSNAPAVASSGKTYLVAAGGGKAALLDRAGTLQKIIDFGGPHTDHEVAPDVAWDGSRYIVLHADPADPEDYVSTFVSETGEISSPNENVDGNRVAARNGVVVIFSGADVIAGDDGFLTISLSPDHRTITGRHLDPSGAPDDSSFVIASGGIYGQPPRGAWTGRDYTVVFSDIDTPYVVHVTRAGPAGASATLGSFETAGADVAWNGNSTLLTWSKVNEVFFLTIHAGRIDNDAIVTDHIVHRQHDHQIDPSLATTGAGLFAAWYEWGEADGVFRSATIATFVTASGNGPRLSLPMNGSILAVAGAPTSALVVQFERGLRPMIVTPRGWTAVRAVLATETNGSVAATWTGREYLVTWAQPLVGTGWSIYALRIAENGTVLDSDLRHIADTFHTGALAVASNGRSSLIVDSSTWTFGGPLGASLVGDSIKRIDRLAPFGYYSNINVATDGSSYLVTWRDRHTITGGRIVGANGEPFGDIHEYSREYAQSLFTFWTGENYLLVWTWNREVWGLRISSDGNPIDAAPHLIATLDSPALSIAQFAPSQLAMITSEGTEIVDRHLMLRYALAPRQRSAKR